MRWESNRNQIKGKLHDIDIYDQSLIELRRVVNNRKQFNNLRYYNIINDGYNTIMDLGHDAGIPTDRIKMDIDKAIEGGRCRDILKPQDYNSVRRIDLDRKKKRRVTKVKRCKCK